MRDLPDALADDLPGAFQRLVVSYQDRLFSFALRMAGSREDAEEIVQEAFVRAYRALERYDRARIRALALRPWLYQITLNLARNRARRRQPRLVSMDGLESPDAPGGGGPGLQAPDALTAWEQRAHIIAALGVLPRPYRTAVVLRHVEGLPYAEIARVLRQPVGTVKANVHRGVRLLRARLIDERPEG
jgi:RNA polymerase sigma-70 factor (ECF subfamily)